MKHTIESLMQLIRKFARSDMEPNYSKYEQLVTEAITEVLSEQENLRRANLDCVDHFNQLKEDYDKLLEELKFAHMEGYEGGKQEARDAAHLEIDELKLDAERYRWLRKSHHGDKLGVEVRIGGYSGFYWHGNKSPIADEKLDEAIDAAMKGTI